MPQQGTEHEGGHERDPASARRPVPCGPSGYGGSMTAPDAQPNDTAPVLDGTDVSADPDALETSETPATSDPEQLTDEELGGVAGAGGAG